MSYVKYDEDCTMWNPSGKILQIDYAMEAMKQGTLSVALKNKESSILVAMKKNPSKLACY